MSARDHTQIEELLAVRALGGLDGEDVAALDAALASHGPDCAECRRIEAECSDVAGRLAFALTPLPADDAIAERILAITRAGPPTVVRPTAVHARSRGWALAIAAAAAAAAAVMVVAALVLPPSATQRVSATWSQRVVPFEGGAGALAMAYTPGQTGIVVIGRDLPDPGPGHTYEVWTIRGGVAASAGCLVPSGGSFTAALDADPNGADLMAVTVEPARCPSQPTTTPAYTAQPAVT